MMSYLMFFFKFKNYDNTLDNKDYFVKKYY